MAGNFAIIEWSSEEFIENTAANSGFQIPHGGAWAIGNFDGVHKGHQKVLSRVLNRVQTMGGKALVMTFEPHPRSFFNPDNPLFRLTPRIVKAELIAALGFDGVVFVRFDNFLANLKPERFTRGIMAGKFGASYIAVGDDFRFGAGRKGTPELLRHWLCQYDCKVETVAPLYENQGVVSSSAVRNLLALGEVERAAELLGYHWFVRAEVVHGDKRGKKLGFPTANLMLDENVRLRHGVYAVTVRVAGRLFKGAANFGSRPTFGSKRVILEVYLFDFSEDLYGRDLEVAFIGFLRPEQRFDQIDQLIAQMKQDVVRANKLLASRAEQLPLDHVLAEGVRVSDD